MPAAPMLALRYAVFYGGFFLAVGVLLPFWPLWLESRGLGAGQIGLLLALAPWIRVLTNPVVAHFADRSGRAKTVLVILAALSLAGFAGFVPARGFGWIFVVSVFAAICFPAMLPLGESQVMAAVLRHRLDYGRIRLWGSITFIAATFGAGGLLTGRDPDLVLLLVLGAVAATLLAALQFPGQSHDHVRADRRGFVTLLRRPGFLLFLLTASLLQASHAVYNGFSALHWRAAGISETVIGGLWAEGVIAEIALFAVSAVAVARARPAGLLFIAGLCGILRWSVLAETTALTPLAGAQLLHAATFGAVHLGAMHFLARAAPPGLSATAQGLYTSVAGVTMGVAMLIAGTLYGDLHGDAFYAMAAASAGGAALALVLWRRDRGGPPGEPL